jgi:MFS family permease
VNRLPGLARFGRTGSYRWVVLAVAFLGIFGAMGFGRFGYSAVLPDMQAELGLSGAESGSLASWNLVGYTLMAFVGGLLATRYGARRVVTAGMVLTAAGMVLTGFAASLVMASAGRFLTGIGNGMVMAPSIALMASWFDTRRLGLASAIAASGNGLGLVVAGPAVPRLIASGGAQGWRWAWFFFALVTIVMATLTLGLQRDRPADVHEDAAPRRARRPATGRPFTAADARPVAATVTAAHTGITDLRRVLRSGYAWHLGAVNFLYGFAYLIYFTFFQKRLTADLELSSEAAGALFLAAGAASLTLGVLGGATSDRIGRGRALSVLLGLQAVAALLFGLGSGLAGLVVSAIIFGIGVFAIPALIGAACGDGFGPRLAFASLGFVTIFIGVGMVIGPYVGGWMEDRLGSLGPSYLLSAGVFLVGAVTALLLPDRRGTSGRRRPDALS